MKRAVIFPGQGAQYVGMGMDLAEKYPVAREILEQADNALDFALSDIIANGPESELTRTDISQPAILAVSWMAYTVLDRALNPLHFDLAAGLSLGEYTAWVAVGALDFSDALRLVRLRGEAMQQAAEARAGGMVALIGADEAKAQALCEAICQPGEELGVANLNSTGQVVIAGDQAACERAVTAAKEHGLRRAMPLTVAGAFHSPLMASAVERLHQALAEVRFRTPCRPVYSNVSASPVTDPSAIAGLLERQLTSPVRWAASMQAMVDAGCGHFIELGPGKTLGGMLARTVKDVSCDSVDRADQVLTAIQAVGAV